MFSSVKLNAVTMLTNAHASLLSWTVDPSLVRLDVINNTRFAQLTADINTVLARSVHFIIKYLLIIMMLVVLVVVLTLNFQRCFLTFLKLTLKKVKYSNNQTASYHCCIRNNNILPTGPNSFIHIKDQILLINSTLGQDFDSDIMFLYIYANY
jgi:hypothetical protein